MSPSLGRLGRFVPPDKLTGWVWVEEPGEIIQVKAIYNGKVVGIGAADKPRGRDDAPQKNGTRVKRGFVIRLTDDFTLEQVRDEGFEVIAFTPTLQFPLVKADDLTLRVDQPIVSYARKERAHEFHNSSVELSQVTVAVGTQSGDGVAIVGREGFLFLVGGTNDARRMYSLPDNGTSDQWANLLIERQRKISGNGKKFFQVFIPEKTTVLAEYYPDAITVPTAFYRGLKDKIACSNELSSDVIFVDDLFDSQMSIRAYRKTDSHLTSLGARAVFDAMLERLGECVSYSVVDKVEIVDRWDLGAKFAGLNIVEAVELFRGIDFEGTIMEPRLKEECLSSTGNVGTRRVYVNESAPIDKKVIAFANSFFWSGGTSLGQCWWFSRFFSEFHFVWSPSVDYAYVNDVAPDIVICQSIERFMRRVPKD